MMHPTEKSHWPVPHPQFPGAGEDFQARYIRLGTENLCVYFLGTVLAFEPHSERKERSDPEN